MTKGGGAFGRPFFVAVHPDLDFSAKNRLKFSDENLCPPATALR
jgi:hypothetical protein